MKMSEVKWASTYFLCVAVFILVVYIIGTVTNPVIGIFGTIFVVALIVRVTIYFREREMSKDERTG